MQTKLLSITVGPNILYKPQPKQALFHESEAEEILYGGAAGGGKSHSILWDAYMNCFKHSGLRVVMFRRTYPELEKSLIFKSRMYFSEGMGKYNESKKRWIIYCEDGGQSWIEFAHCKDESDVFNYQSAEYDIEYFDELTHFTEFQYLYLKTRVRTTRTDGFKPKIKAATNPGNIGHGWVRKRWKLSDKTNYFKVWNPDPTEDEPNPGSRVFIPARLDDNQILMNADPNYINRLKSLPEQQRKQLLDGDWEVFSGQAFTEWDPKIHVIKPFDIPKHWERWSAVDFGFSKPFAGLWFAMDPCSRRMYCYRELYGAQIRDVLQAKRMVAMSRMSDGIPEKINFNVADPSIWANRGNGLSTAEVYAINGYNVIPGNNDRIMGKMRVHDYLSMASDGKPWLQIFNNCVNLIRTLPELILDTNNTEDVNTKQEDHAYDALRYFLMTRPSMKTDTIDEYNGISTDPASRSEWMNLKRLFLKEQNSRICNANNFNKVDC